MRPVLAIDGLLPDAGNGIAICAELAAEAHGSPFECPHAVLHGGMHEGAMALVIERVQGILPQAGIETDDLYGLGPGLSQEYIHPVQEKESTGQPFIYICTIDGEIGHGIGAFNNAGCVPYTYEGFQQGLVGAGCRGFDQRISHHVGMFGHPYAKLLPPAGLLFKGLGKGDPVAFGVCYGKTAQAPGMAHGRDRNMDAFGQ